MRWSEASLLVTALAVLAATAAAARPARDRPDGLALPATAAFAIGTEIRVADVRETPPDSFNVMLRDARSRGEDWTASAVQVGLRLAQLPPLGQRQEVSVEIPGEWEPGMPLTWARVTVFNGGWLDDSATGERYVIWVGSDPAGGLIVRRALWARLCDRPSRRFWSAKPCP